MTPATGDGPFELAGLEQVPTAGDDPTCFVPGTGNESGFRYVSEAVVGLDPEGVAVDHRTGLAYVACSRSDHVAVVDPATGALVTTVGVGREPIDIVIDPVTNRAFTADARSNQLSVLDLESHEVLDTVPVGDYPAGLAIDVENRRLYCGDTMGSTVSVVDVDELVRLHTVPAELGAGAMAVDPDRHRAYCVNFVASSMTVVDTAVVGGGPAAVVGSVQLGKGACAVAVNPGTPDVYAINSLASQVAQVDADTCRVVAEYPVPNAPVGLTAGPHGDRLYVANRGDGSVSVLGLDGTEWVRVPVGTAPGGVIVHPSEPRRVLVANAGSGTLTVFDDLSEGPSSVVTATPHPLVGRQLPSFRLPDVEGRMRESAEWATKRYIVNFFASW